MDTPSHSAIRVQSTHPSTLNNNLGQAPIPRAHGTSDGNDSDTSEDDDGAPAAKRPKSSASSVNTSGNDVETPPPQQNGAKTEPNSANNSQNKVC